MKDNTKRFSDRVDIYQKYRPSYPNEVVNYIFDKFGLCESSIIADVGSGTGMFTELLLGKCSKVYAVEPNNEMRYAADSRLLTYTSYNSVNGTSENTTLASKSIDGITVAQAFHWFNINTTRQEFTRILKDNKYVFLIWNDRTTNTPFLIEYENILKSKIPEYNEVNHKNITPEIMKGFLIRDYTEISFQNNQLFTLDGVLGRLQSSSYTPKTDSNEYRVVESEIIKAFNHFSDHGVISFNYNTVVYAGKIT
jgi:ubiquinone/menaquinone biosynthesis C-methylase UbiE